MSVRSHFGAEDAAEPVKRIVRIAKLINENSNLCAQSHAEKQAAISSAAITMKRQQKTAIIANWLTETNLSGVPLAYENHHSKSQWDSVR